MLQGGVWFGGVCRHTKTAKPAKTVNGLDGRVASPVFLGPMSAVIAAARNRQNRQNRQTAKTVNATHPLDHTPPLQHLDFSESFWEKLRIFLRV